MVTELSVGVCSTGADLIDFLSGLLLPCSSASGCLCPPGFNTRPAIKAQCCCCCCSKICKICKTCTTASAKFKWSEEDPALHWKSEEQGKTGSKKPLHFIKQQHKSVSLLKTRTFMYFPVGWLIGRLIIKWLEVVRFSQNKSDPWFPIPFTLRATSLPSSGWVFTIQVASFLPLLWPHCSGYR